MSWRRLSLVEWMHAEARINAWRRLPAAGKPDVDAGVPMLRGRSASWIVARHVVAIVVTIAPQTVSPR
jgi:hypothetical protein